MIITNPDLCSQMTVAGLMTYICWAIISNRRLEVVLSAEHPGYAELMAYRWIEVR